MTSKFFLSPLFAVLLVGCAAPARGVISAGIDVETARPPLAKAPRCGMPLPVTGQDVWTVEGFGGGGDRQLLMSARQPARQCVPASGAATTTAALGAQQ